MSRGYGRGAARALLPAPAALGETARVGLRLETIERVRAYWAAWEAQSDLLDRVSVVVIGRERFACAPERLRGRIKARAPTDLTALIEILGDDVEAAAGEARLAYADDASLRPVATDGVTGVADNDPRLAALRAASDPYEWSEAGTDEPCDLRFGVPDT